VNKTFTDQSSIVRFTEDNWLGWLGGQQLGGGAADVTAGTLSNMFDFSHPSPQPLMLNPKTGQQ
jgi:phospholipase C